MIPEKTRKLVFDEKEKSNGAPAPIGNEWLWEIGANYHIRTVSHYFTGTFLGFNGPNNCELAFRNAAWIADDGRFTQAMADGTLSEVEPYPVGSVLGINRSSIIDFIKVGWPLPLSQK